MKAIINNITEAIIKLWHTKSELSFKNIRTDHLHYTLSLAFCIILADFQGSFFITHVKVLNIDSTALMNIAYSIAAALIMVIRLKDLKLYMTASSIVTGIGFVLWFLIPVESVRFIMSLFCWMGLGGCAACAVFAYGFVLNNSERLLTIIIITFNSGMLTMLYEFGLMNSWTKGIIPAILIIAIVICILKFKSDDFPAVNKSEKPKINDPSGLIMVCVVAFYTINFFSDYLLRSLRLRITYTIGIIVSVIIVITILIILRCSIWHMWNFFLTASTAGTLMIFFSEHTLLRNTGALFLGSAIGCGYAVIFYYAGGLVKQKSSFLFFKYAMFFAVIITLIPSTASSLVASTYPVLFPTVTFIICIFTLLLFTTLSPVLYRNLFGNSFINENRKEEVESSDIDITSAGLTPREREVYELLREGNTLRQISAIIGIKYSTVNTYCTSLYRKLKINSRTELIVKYGVRSKIL